MEDFKPFNLAQIYQNADASVANAMQANLMVMQAAQMKREYDEEDALRTLARRSTSTDSMGNPQFDLKSFTKGAYGINPMKGLAFEKTQREAEKATLERDNLQGQIDERRMKMAAEKLKVMHQGSVVPYMKWKELTDGGMPDAEARAQVQPLYESALQGLTKSGLFKPEEVQQILATQPQQFDPTVSESAMRYVLDVKDQLADYWKKREMPTDLNKDADAFARKQLGIKPRDTGTADPIESMYWEGLSDEERPAAEAKYREEHGTEPPVMVGENERLSPEGLAEYHRTRAEFFRSNGRNDLAGKALEEATKADELELRKGELEEKNKARGEAQKKREFEQDAKKKEQTLKLSDDFRQEPGVQKYRTVQPLLASMENALNMKGGTADVDMIYALATIFDPGSVVREGEQLIIKRAGGLPSEVQSWIGWVNGGNQLTQDVRQQMLNQAKSRVGNYKQAYDSTIDSYSKQAKRWDINVDDIVRDYKVEAKGDGKSSPGQGTKDDPFTIKGDDDFAKLPSGAHFKGPDGVLRVKP